MDKPIGTLITLSAIVFLFTVMSGVGSAQQSSIDISVTVEGFNVENGETLEVGENPVANISVESDEVIDHIIITTNGQKYARGLETRNFSINRTLDIAPGMNTMDIEVETRNGTVREFQTVLNWEPETVEEVRWTLNRLEVEIGDLERQNEELRGRLDNLSQRNQVLMSTNQELRNDLQNATGGGLVPGLPGFTYLSGIIALLGVLLMSRRIYR